MTIKTLRGMVNNMKLAKTIRLGILVVLILGITGAILISFPSSGSVPAGNQFALGSLNSKDSLSKRMPQGVFPLGKLFVPKLAQAPVVSNNSTQIAINYHAQQDPDWCDPADIEMWLQADGVSFAADGDYTAQQGFWSYETSNNDGYSIAEWNASPYAVAVTLDHFGGWSDIGDEPQPTANAAGEGITYSIAVKNQPVIVMVGGGTHYVLITGVTLSSAGVNAPPEAVTFDDPLAYGVAGSPPSGSDGSQTMDWTDFSSWYTANTSHGGVWAGQWVLIAAGIPLVG